MSLFHSNKTKIIKSEVTDSGIIKITQVKLDNNGNIPSGVRLHDDSWVLSPKDITPSEYKGLIYAVPIPENDSYIAVSYPSTAMNKFVVKKRDVVKI